LKVENGKFAEVRIALGGVAHKPWRAGKAESILAGSAPSAELFEHAAAAELTAAVPRRDNALKVELAKRTMADVLTELTPETEGAR